eukprot:1159744-Pelagomonas_calceolata.AAC.13
MRHYTLFTNPLIHHNEAFEGWANSQTAFGIALQFSSSNASQLWPLNCPALANYHASGMRFRAVMLDSKSIVIKKVHKPKNMHTHMQAHQQQCELDPTHSLLVWQQEQHTFADALSTTYLRASTITTRTYMVAV